MALTLQNPHFGCTSPLSIDLSRKFGLICNYLENNNSSAEYIAKELTTRANVPSSGDFTEYESSLEGYLWSLWATILKMIQQIPHAHPWQDRMVNILAAIKKAPRHVTAEMEELEQSWGMTFWQDLPIFGAEISESWNDGPWEVFPEDMPRFPGEVQFSPDVWANLNAFTARLTAAPVVNFEFYPIWILRHTLEEERKDQEVDDNLPAASMWIIYAGRRIYHNAARVITEPATKSPPYVRSLRKFSKSFSKERWSFWKERFAFFQNHETLKQSTRDSAGEALSRMAEIEQSDPEPMISEDSFLPISGMRTALIPVQGMSGDEPLP